MRRGKFPGYVCVFALPEILAAQERLDAFARSTDGFDLAVSSPPALRGPGDLFGTRQHGMPPLRIADLQRDQQSEEARRDAATRFASDKPQFFEPEFDRLK